MKNNLHQIEQTELLEIAPTLASLPKLAVTELFVTPANYFETLDTVIQNHPLINKANPFILPQGYFEILPEKIAQHAFVLKHNPFIVPDSYFDLLPNSISNAVVGNFSNKNEWAAPEGYFEKLPYIIQSKVQQSKKREWVLGFPVLPQFKLAFVASLIIGIISASFYFNGIEKENQNLQASVSKQDIQIALETSMVSAYDEEILIDAIDENKQPTVKKHADAISNYLIDNNIDISTLSDEL